LYIAYYTSNVPMKFETYNEAQIELNKYKENTEYSKIFSIDRLLEYSMFYMMIIGVCFMVGMYIISII